MMTRRNNVAMRESNDNYAQSTHFEVISSFSEQLFQEFSQFYGLRSYLSLSSFSYAVTLKLLHRNLFHMSCHDFIKKVKL